MEKRSRTRRIAKHTVSSDGGHRQLMNRGNSPSNSRRKRFWHVPRIYWTVSLGRQFGEQGQGRAGILLAGCVIWGWRHRGGSVDSATSIRTEW
jgi:hypothetical protein